MSNPPSPILDEFGVSNHNTRGTIAMANTGQANSARCQFFINVVDNSQRTATFDNSYAVFGDVIHGMDVADAISNVATTGDNAANKPLQDVTLISAEILP